MIDLEQLANRSELFDGRYKLLRPLSTDGGTADVWLAIDVNTIDNPLVEDEHEKKEKGDDTGMLVAIKIYRPKNALDIEGEQRFRDEFKIVYECRHANVLQPTSFSIYNDLPYLVLPYCKFGSSEQLIGKKQKAAEIWKFILDVASGLERLHSNTPQIVHQDIKPANILIDNNLNFAITDFGISSKMGGVHGYYYDDDNNGTLAYMAPERYQEGTEPMPQSDIWAFGATLCEILTGQVPFGESGGREQLKGNTPMPALTGVPADIQRLIHACLDIDLNKRPTARQLIEAAKAKEFPVKSKAPKYIVLALVCALLVGGALYFLLSRQGETKIIEVEKVMTEEEVKAFYDHALGLMNSDNADSLKVGLAQMDSLSGTNYVPAIYQMALTYGWYSDPVSVKRKQLMGIEMDDSYMPKADHYSNRAVGLFTRIMELNDSAYADINANATYRLACYYVMPNNIYKPNYDKGKRFLLKSREWATLAGDQDLLEKIQRGLATFE
jgi:hypothetical protein